MTYPDGRSYSGNWKEGGKHGIGVQKYKDGKEKKHLWREGKNIRTFELD